MKNLFLSCDWGTSSFRLRLIDSDTRSVLHELVSKDGIAAVYNQWESLMETAGISRREFYVGQLKAHIEKLSDECGISLSGIVVVISGMASSSIGIKELPYAALPFNVDGTNAITEQFPATPDFPHQLILVSGLAEEHDVMRGEETQLIGLVFTENGSADEEVMYIFPGTHSKHLRVKHRQLTGFKTYITGELFEVLSHHSILKASVTKPGQDQSPDAFQMEAFNQGIAESAAADLLHTLFSVRINHLFRVLSREQNFFYLSGLLIGSELVSLKRDYSGKIKLCSGHHLYSLYHQALISLDMMDQVSLIDPEIIDKSAVDGQITIFQLLNNKT